MVYLFFVKAFFTSTLDKKFAYSLFHLNACKVRNNAISIHNDFKIVKVDQASFYSTIQRWVKHF